MTEKKIVYVNEWQGDDKNNGLSANEAVLTRERALEVSRRERTDGFDITGSWAFILKTTRLLPAENS
jgi:hypothetical protein